MKRVLAIGNCGFDNSSLRAKLQQTFQAELDTADSLLEAVGMCQQQTYALVIFNRIFDASGDSGLVALREFKTQASTSLIPCILLSNFAQYQVEAIALGAEPGFGKAELHAPETKILLAKYLT
jgi:CheY-like chemotaxis protein